MEDVTLTMGGLAQNLDDPARRNVTVNLEGLATGVWSDDPEVAAALGSRIDLFADVALPAGRADRRPPAAAERQRALDLQRRHASRTSSTPAATRCASPTWRSSPASPARDLGGAIDLSADGSVSPLQGGFDLTFDGDATDLRLGEARLDPLLAGTTTLAGRAVRDANGIRTENLRLENPQLSFASNGQLATGRTDIGFDARLADLALVDPRAGGALTATGRAAGQGVPISVMLDAAVEQGTLMGRRLTGVRLGFDGSLDGADVTGSLSGGGQLDELVLRLAGDIALGRHRPQPDRAAASPSGPTAHRRPDAARRRAHRGHARAPRPGHRPARRLRADRGERRPRRRPHAGAGRDRAGRHRLGARARPGAGPEPGGLAPARRRGERRARLAVGRRARSTPATSRSPASTSPRSTRAPSRPTPTACASRPMPGWRSARSPTSRARSPGCPTASPRRSRPCACARARWPPP